MRLSSLMKELQELCRDFQIQDAHSFLFRGEHFQTTQNNKNSKQDQDTMLVDSLLEVLYSKCYMRVYSTDVEQAESFNDDDKWMSLLEQANQTQLTLDRGWCIYQVNSDGRISVQKADRSRAANPGEFVRDTFTGNAPQIGQLVDLCVYPGSSELQSVFYFAFGSTLTDQFDEYALVRFYFNVTASGAPELLRRLSTTLNYYSIPYRYKCLARPRFYNRADAAVLYISKRYLNIVADIVDEFYPSIKTYLRSGIPMFCYEFLPGIGVADDTGTGESFGKHRCRLLAEALVHAWTDNLYCVEEKIELIRKRFESEGLSLQIPYLNAGARDVFSELTRTGVSAKW